MGDLEVSDIDCLEKARNDMSSATSPAMPPFSYAQAAKGFAPSKSSSQNASSAQSTTSDGSPQGRKHSSTEPAKLDLTPKSTTSPGNDQRNLGGDKGNPETPARIASTQSATNKENVPPRTSGALRHETKRTTSETSSPSFGATSTSTLPKEEYTTATSSDANDNWEKQSQVSTSVEKSTQTTTGNKAKDSEDDWEKVSVSTAPPEKELRAAPIPAVNPWLARKEAQDAKAKAPSVQKTSSTVAPASSVKEEQVSSAKPAKQQQSESSQGQAQGATTRIEADDVLTRRKSAKQGRQQANGGEVVTRPALPPVGNAELWPKPDTSTLDERKKSASQDRPEEPEPKKNSAKPKYEKYPYVPSAKFETDLPPAASRRSGRPAIRGGNHAESRAGTSGQGSGGGGGAAKNDAASGSMGPPPLPNKSTDQDRGRRPATSTGSRASSVPTQVKREPSVNASSLEQHKLPFTLGSQSGSDFHTQKTDTTDAAVATSRMLAEDFSNTRKPRSDSNSFEKFTPVSTDSSFQRGSSESNRPSGQAGETHAHPRNAVSSRKSIPADFYGSSDVFGAYDPPYGGRTKEYKARDYGRDKENSRDKVNSWRDRDTPYDKDGREQRGERTRGGTRGRGNHPTYGAHPASAHPYTAPLPQQPFASGKSHSYQSTYRQDPQPYSTMALQAAQRTNIRSQSIPTPNMYASMMQMQQPLSPTLSDMPAYGYPQQMHPAMMSAIPYDAALNSFGVVSLVKSQMEYYFSIDNLCKDMFLRKHMDSQGFVPLSVIADFKRMRSLTQGVNGMELLRNVCTDLKSIELRAGQDGIDRLRRREGWEQWVLPMSQREVAAQNEGPPPAFRPTYQPNGSNEYFPYFGSSSTTFRPARQWNGEMSRHVSDSVQSLEIPQETGSIGARFSETPVSATAPAFSPNGHISPFTQDTGFTGEVMAPQVDHQDVANMAVPSISGDPRFVSSEIDYDGDNFPDQGIHMVKVMRRPTDAIPAAALPRFLSNSRRTFSHGSVDGQLLGSEHHSGRSSSTGTLGLRGGSGSGEQ